MSKYKTKYIDMHKMYFFWIAFIQAKCISIFKKLHRYPKSFIQIQNVCPSFEEVHFYLLRHESIPINLKKKNICASRITQHLTAFIWFMKAKTVTYVRWQYDHKVLCLYMSQGQIKTQVMRVEGQQWTNSDHKVKTK